MELAILFGKRKQGNKMFENILGPKAQMKAEFAAEQRQMNFGREQTVMQSATDTSSDQLYYNEQESKADLLRWQQDLDDQLLKLVMTLRGYGMVDGKWIKVSEALCNDFFIHEVVIPQCEPYLNRNLFNTNYTEKSILGDLKETMNDVCDAMADNYDRYEIVFTNFDLVRRKIINTIKPGIFRALNGWTKKTDSTISKRIEALNEQMNTEPKKKWGGFSV